MVTVSARFMGSFKLGDNIHHNLDILTYMYERLDDENDTDASLLRKPIIVLIASVAEAVLHDLHMRMKTHTIEGVRGVANSVLTYVRGKQIDKFDTYIVSARKHSLLGPPSEKIYSDLEELRKLRNRIHIQNEKGHFEPDDSRAFNAERQATAERTLESLMKHISDKHPRAEGAQGYVGDFQLPWDEHF